VTGVQTCALPISLAMGDYKALATQLRLQSRTLYVGDQQLMYLRIVEKLFAETPVPAAEIPKAIAALDTQGIAGAPLAMAALGSLHMREPSPPVDAVATDAIALLRENPELIGVIPLASLSRLAAYMLKANNTCGAAEAVV